MGRTIGIQHRIKRSADGESRPTIVHVLDGKRTELSAEKDEAKFLGTLAAGDTLAAALGGSGDYLVFAASRVAEAVGAKVIVLAPAALKDERERRGFPASRENDAELLAILAAEAPERFYPVAARDRDLIALRLAYRARMDAMKDRIACEQRIRQRVIGMEFCKPDGLYPEGDVEKAFKDAKANDVIYKALEKEENRRDAELAKACEALDVYREAFALIEGVGPATAARIIASVADIRRFKVEPDSEAIARSRARQAEAETRARLSEIAPHIVEMPSGKTRYEATKALGERLRKENNPEGTELIQAAHEYVVRRKIRRKAFEKSRSRFVAYCGVHVLSDGRFPRRRNNERANWSNDCRSALGPYGFGKQANYRPDSEWGQRLRAIKGRMRERHPEPVKTETGAKKYSDAHIAKMAGWRLATKLAESIFGKWWEVEFGPRPAASVEVREAA